MQFFDRMVCPIVNLLIQDLPVNIKFIIEGMEEAGSVALEELVRREKDRFFSSVDYVVISDNLWISRRKPALTYGTRGNSYFTVEVFANDGGAQGGIHSGTLVGKREGSCESRVGTLTWMCGPGDHGGLGTGAIMKTPKLRVDVLCSFLEKGFRGVCDSQTKRFRNYGCGIWRQEQQPRELS